MSFQKYKCKAWMTQMDGSVALVSFLGSARLRLGLGLQ